MNTKFFTALAFSLIPILSHAQDASREEVLAFVLYGMRGCSNTISVERNDDQFFYEGQGNTNGKMQFSMSDVRATSYPAAQFITLACTSGACLSFTAPNSDSKRFLNETVLSCGDNMAPRMVKAINYYSDKFGKKSKF